MKKSPLKTELSDHDVLEFRRMLERELEPNVKANDETNTFPLDFFAKLHSLGYLQAFLPHEWGGQDLSTFSLAKMMRSLGYFSAGVSTSFAGNLLAWVPILKAGHAHWLENHAQNYAKRFFLSSFCFTEPDHGSDVYRISTQFEDKGDHFVLQGKKCFVTNGSYADQFVVVARKKSSDPAEKEFQLFLVPGETAGITRANAYDKMGHRDSNTTDIFFDDVHLPKDKILNSAPGFSGIDLAFHSIQRSRVLLAAAACGVAERALSLSETYLKERKLYGKPLLLQPQIRAVLVQGHAELESVWQMCRSAAEKWDNGGNEFAPSSMTKLLAGQMVSRVTQNAVELMGGWGCMKEFGVEKLFRDGKFYDILEGPTFVQHAIIAKELFSERIPQTQTHTNNENLRDGCTSFRAPTKKAG